ncbi:MAG TPA: hypothetical protein VGG76_07640, partial [Gemmatimonadaceae bacterium]
IGALNLPLGTQDFGFSLGVLHHVPDTYAGLEDAVRLLKPGAPFLLYLYYAFDNRPTWFQRVWQLSDLCRRFISAMPARPRDIAADVFAGVIYWPLARFSRWWEGQGHAVSNIPLSAYRDLSFYTMRTDALDRLGTPLERRFTKEEIESMMQRAGLVDIRFSDHAPFWVACGVARSLEPTGVS